MSRLSRLSSKLRAPFAIRSYSSQLPVKDIKHNSVEIDLENVKFDVDTYFAHLEGTLAELKQNSRNAVFLKIPVIQSQFIKPSRRSGFKFHHAEGDSAVMMLWLAPGESKVPTFATHHVGVGAVVKSGNDVLVVKEHPPMNKFWKFPGGYANLGEHFGETAVREVMEETGVKSEFSHVLSLRHSHEEQFGRSNIYVVCVLNALSKEILLDTEIEAAEWMPLETFRDNVSHSPMTSLITDLAIQENEGLKEVQMQYPIAGRLPFKLYHSYK